MISDTCPICDAVISATHTCPGTRAEDDREITYVDQDEATPVTEPLNLDSELRQEEPASEVVDSDAKQEIDSAEEASPLLQAAEEMNSPLPPEPDSPESSPQILTTDAGQESQDEAQPEDDKEEPRPLAPDTNDSAITNDSTIDLNPTPFGQVANVEGTGAAFSQEIQYIFNLPQAKDSNQKDEEEKTLVEFTTVLPAREAPLPGFIAADVCGYFKKFTEERLLLISCPDEDLAIAAAMAIMDKLGLPQREQKRLLTFDRSLGEQQIPNIYHLRKKEANDTGIAILIDATTERGRPFLDSIFYSTKMSLAAFGDDLKRNNLYILCMVEPAKPESDLTSFVVGQSPFSRFTYWPIVFLPQLLQVNYPEQHEDLERKILAQRERGWWSLNENEFYFELKSYIERRELPAVVQARETSPPPPPPDSLFKGDDSLKDTVIYVATFFPNLTPNEFSQVVTLLLNRRRLSGTKQIIQNEIAGSPGNERTGHELLAHLWQETPDKLLKELCLVATPIRDATRGITFTNHKIRESLKEHLEDEYCLYLEGRFQSLQALGLLFSPSSRIAGSVIELTADMMLSYPEYYGGSWLAEIVASFEQTLIPGNEALRADSPAWRFLADDLPGRARRQVYLRITELIRLLLDEPRLAELVDEFFAQLLLTKTYCAVLELVKRLRFVPEFDQFKWLKQLLDRGDPDTRQQVSIYLYGLLRKMDTRIYQVLRNLEPWLPDESRPLPSYSVSAKFALQCLPSYCLDIASRFNEKNFGYWQGQYPLFTFKDIVTANSNLRLLTKWLFHVGIESAFKEWHYAAETRRQINILITGWFFFLQGRGESPTQPQYQKIVDADRLIDGSSVSRILLQLIAEDATPKHLRELLTHWGMESRTMLVQLSTKAQTRQKREELTWKRNLIIELAGKLKQLRPDVRTLPQGTKV